MCVIHLTRLPLKEPFSPLPLCMNIRRAIKFWWQRRTRGWDDSETWSLDMTLCKWLLPRLQRFRELSIGYPYPLESQAEWEDVLDKMILAIKLIAEQDENPDWQSEVSRDEIERGLDLFRKYFLGLWW